jgi:hypothetical protein
VLPSPEDQAALQSLTARLKVILPETYHTCIDDIRPNPMGSAGLKFDDSGRVAWDKIWNSFCDLAMAGGPPHKGKLLPPGTDHSHDTSAEIIRGIHMTTGLKAEPSHTPGWLRVHATNETMAAWLARAITMENVAVHLDQSTLELPTSPDFRIEKEVKSVIVTLAKTFHYWSSHMSPAQHQQIAALFAASNQRYPLLQPQREPHAPTTIQAPKSLVPAEQSYPGWQGFACPNLWAAVWMMRALSVENVLARRESNILFLPTNPSTDPTAAIASQALHHVHRMAGIHGIL